MKFDAKRLFIIGQWIAIIIAVLIIRKFELDWAYYVLGAIALFTIAYRVLNNSNPELIIEVSCNPTKYLLVIEKKKKKNGDSLYNMQKAYAYIHLNLLDEAVSCFNNVDFQEISNKKRYYHIYIMIRTRFLYKDNNLEGLIGLIKEVTESEFKTEPLIDYLKVYRLLQEERKEDTIDQLKSAIPNQAYRVQIFELEHLLSRLYFETEQYIDSAYVASFISEKKFDIIYIEWCKAIAIAANEHIKAEDN
jgi:hypothetical protein